MIAAIHLDLPDIDMGGGMVATEAVVVEAPLALIKIRRRDRRESSRLDLQKRAFLDRMSSEPSQDGIAAVVAAVYARLLGTAEVH
jgi:hypothetical protein